ncbi:MAG TPA: CinA family protein [Sphingobacteriaceae bacterium]|nr:CinA family protein [Sphingobacteriaceae bacterium]
MTAVDPLLIQRVSGLLARHQLKLMLAESMTAGAIAAHLSLGVNAGDYLMGSIVCYDDEIKSTCLGVDSRLIERYGGVSPEVTKALTDGLARNFPQGKLFVAVTGFAFESPAVSEEDPVGTTYIYLRMGEIDCAKRYVLEGSPEQIIAEAVTLVLLLLENNIHQLQE